MRKHYSLTRIIPGLRKILFSLVPKFLDFSDFPEQKALTNLLIEERNLKLQYRNNSENLHNLNLELIDLITANSIENIELVRIGPSNDGGYFLPTYYLKTLNWITIGLGENIEFENVLASKNLQVYSFDHTTQRRPRNLSTRVRYFQYGWGNNLTNKGLISLAKMTELADFQQPTASDWGLKFDIEGNEWDLLPEITQLENKPILIVSELHNLIPKNNDSKHIDKLLKLNKVLEDYAICAVHGNNYSKYLMTEQYGLYDIIEMTFVRRDIIIKCKVSHNPINVLEYRNFERIVQMPIGRTT